MSRKGKFRDHFLGEEAWGLRSALWDSDSRNARPTAQRRAHAFRHREEPSPDPLNEQTLVVNRAETIQLSGRAMSIIVKNERHPGSLSVIASPIGSFKSPISVSGSLPPIAQSPDRLRLSMLRRTFFWPDEIDLLDWPPLRRCSHSSSG
jgi:hypothetical protein